MKLMLMTCLACLFVAIPISAENRCTAGDVSTGLVACLKGFQKVMVNMTASDIENYCLNSAAEEVNCTETLVRDCLAGTNTTSYFLYLKDAMKIICDNTEVLSQNNDCIQAALPGVETCSTTAVVTYRAKMFHLAGQAMSKGENWYKDVMQRELCRMNAQTLQCRSVFHDQCGEKIGTMFSAIDELTIQPTCRQEVSIIG